MPVKNFFFIFFCFFSIDCFSQIDLKDYQTTPANILRKFLDALNGEDLQIRTLNSPNDQLYIPYLETNRNIEVRLPEDQEDTRLRVNFLFFQALPDDGNVMTTYHMDDIEKFIDQMRTLSILPVVIEYTRETITFTIGKGVAALPFLYQLVLNIDLNQTLAKMCRKSESALLSKSSSDLRLTPSEGEILMPYNSPDHSPRDYVQSTSFED